MQKMYHISIGYGKLYMTHSMHARNARKTPKRKEKWDLTEKKNFSG